MSKPKPKSKKKPEQPDEINTWRLCEELSIHQAALLINGYSPSKYPSNWDAHDPNQTVGYTASVAALTNAILSDRINATILREWTRDDENERCLVAGSVSLDSRINVKSLKSWLATGQNRPKFFFPDKSDEPDYLDSSNPCYAPKLAAAVLAWLAVQNPNEENPKKTLEKWLEKNAIKFGLVNTEGVLKEAAIEEIAKVANWKPKGGAPKTPFGKK